MRINQPIGAATESFASLLTKAKMPLLVLALVLLLPASSLADNVVLTSGGVSVNVPPGQTSITLSQPGVFSLNYFNPEYFGPLTTSFGFQSITQGFGSLTFQGQTVQFFSGSLSFTDSFLNGQVSGFLTLEDAANNNPLFTVTFTGGGFSGSSLTSRTFTVATPEPTTLLLLGSGLLAVGTKARSRRRRTPGT